MSKPPRPDSKLHRSFTEALRGAWRGVARPEQLSPAGHWTTWVFCGGRGAGKTRSGAEWVQERVAAGSRYVHLIAPTAADCRDVLLEGPAGILSVAPPHLRPVYQPSLRKVVWPNGAQALLFSSDEPDRLRGPQGDTVWIDELCAMRQAQEVLDNMYFGLRVGKDPRCLITTTPRPLKCFKALLARDGQDVVVTRSSSFANRENLAPAFFSQIVTKYAGTRLGRQELEAELLTDTPGALWHLERIEELRVHAAPQPLKRVVVAIDPAVTHGPDSDETGILVVGLGADGCGYVLDDLSGRYPPEEWARRAIQAYRTHSADRIVGEVNNGGALVEHTLRSVDAAIPFTAVHASRGKLVRAEPVSALYEQGRVHHVGVFGPLEDQMTSYDGSRSGSSPDRLDALCWAVSQLMLGERTGGYFTRAALLVSGEPVECRGTSDRPDRVLITLGTCERPGSAIGAVIFAHYGHFGFPVRVLDYALAEVGEALAPQWLATLFARAQQLRTEWDALEEVTALWVDEGQLFETVEAIFHAHSFADGPCSLRYIRQDDGVPPTLDERAERVRAPVNAGGFVKMARSAYARQLTFRSVTSNHLVDQVLGYTPGARDTAQELAAAFVMACAMAYVPAQADFSAAETLSVAFELEPPAPAPSPRPPPPSGTFLRPGRHTIGGALVDVPAEPDGRDLVWFPMPAGQHIVDGVMIRVDRPGAGIAAGPRDPWL